MSRRHALRGVSAIALEFALMAPATIGYAQTQTGGGDKVLPPVTVEAPQTQRAARKPARSVGVAKRRGIPGEAAGNLIAAAFRR